MTKKSSMDICDECCDGCCYKCRDFWYYFLCLAAVAAVVLVVVLVVAYGFIRHVTITVDEASLTRFALVSGPATVFDYNLTIALTIRNRNWAMSFKHTKALEAAYSFDGQRFDRVQVASQGDKHPAGKTVVYRLATGSGGMSVALGNAGLAEFKKENATGVFDVEVALAGEVRYQAHYTKCKLQATCPLKLQLAPPPGAAPAAVVFQKVNCKVAKPDNKNC